MKKVFLFVASFVAFVGFARISNAEQLLVPSGPESALASNDYGGVVYATSAFSASPLRLFQGRGVYSGLSASSGTINDVFLIADTTSTVAATANAAVVFKVTVGTGNYTGSGQIAPTGGVAAPPAPMRMKYGLVVIPPNANYSMVTLFGNPFGDRVP